MTRLLRGVAAVAALCLVTSCASAPTTSSSTGGGCLFGVTWRGVHYADPAEHGGRAEPPESHGRYLGRGYFECADGPSSRMFALYSVPGVSPDVAVTTKDVEYIGIAEGKPVPASLRPVPTPSCGTRIDTTLCARVLRLAHREANGATTRPARHADRWPAAVTLVAVRKHPGTEMQPNVGPACSSGQLITVNVLGTFNRTGVSPGGNRQGQGPPPDHTVNDLVIESDGSTGRACLVGVRTRAEDPVSTDGATIVYRKR